LFLLPSLLDFSFFLKNNHHNLMSRNLLSLVVLLLVAHLSSSHAQSAKWELVPSIGVANYMGDLVVPVYPRIQSARPAVGLGLRRQLTETWSLRLAGQYAQIKGSDLDFDDFRARGFSFSSTIIDGALLAEYDPWGGRRYQRGYLKKTFSPYFFAGVGGTYVDPTTAYNELSDNNQNIVQQINADRNADPTNPTLMLPFGAGIRYDLSSRVTLGAETMFRLPFTDYLDGVSESANPDRRDWYMSSALTLAFRFGKFKDSDGDHVFDRYDKCPTVPGEPTLDGCPDADGDGITDEQDKCPYQRGASNMFGCPDRDADGLADRDDDCPEVHGPRELKGCPDKDNDGIADRDDQCPDLAGVASGRGCPDADLDSIPNAQDKCPTEAGPRVNQGCPDKDTDGDGLVDRLDQCPNQAGLRVLDGCPDTDGDGIVDSRDKCPTQAGTFMNGGCPEIKKEEREALNVAVKGIQFDPAKATLKKTSYANLDKVVEVMKKYPSYNLRISGHTDSDGDDKKNLELSKNRAKTCFDYLVSKGIAASRMTHEGFGETKPLVPNTNKANKAENRRVEFELVLPQ
jgi:OmpA-OmpF porin, OOP family